MINNIKKYEKLYYNDLEVLQYCILPNHFHLLTYNRKKWLNISNFMLKIQLAYAMFFKYKYALKHWSNKTPPFEWRYKAKEINNKKYLEEIQKYISTNPIKHGYVKDTNEWIRKR